MAVAATPPRARAPRRAGCLLAALLLALAAARPGAAEPCIECKDCQVRAVPRGRVPAAGCSPCAAPPRRHTPRAPAGRAHRHHLRRRAQLRLAQPTLALPPQTNNCWRLCKNECPAPVVFPIRPSDVTVNGNACRRAGAGAGDSAAKVGGAAGDGLEAAAAVAAACSLGGLGRLRAAPSLAS
jgi:hypothetical protein